MSSWLADDQMNLLSYLVAKYRLRQDSYLSGGRIYGEELQSMEAQMACPH